MMSVNVQPSRVLVHRDAIPPQSMAANATAQTGWIDAGAAFWIHAKLNVGAVGGGGVVTVTWLQATSAAGAGSKALTGGQFVSTANTTANSVTEIEDVPEQLDVANAFRYVRAVITVTVATCLAALTVEAGPPRFETAASPAS